MTTDLITRESVDLAAQGSSFDLMPVFSVEQAVERRQAIVDFVAACMKKDVDYGRIPGTDKDTLLKPGAEKLATLFGLSTRFTVVEATQDWTGKEHDGEPFFNYWYRCTMYRGSMLIAEGEGSANSWESKYRWRNADRVCPTCGQATIILGKPEYGGGWLCWKKRGGCGASFAETEPQIVSQVAGKVPNTDIHSQVNTLLKMAQKRALIAAVLIAVNASEFFTQDLEDYAPASAPLNGNGYMDHAEPDAAPAPAYGNPSARGRMPGPSADEVPFDGRCQRQGCTAEINQNQHTLSVRKFGVPLCPPCQRNYRPAAA